MNFRQPTPVFLPGESQGRRSLLGAVYGVTQNWTRLTRLSSSSRLSEITSHKKTSTLWFHLSTQSSQFIETESTMVVAWGWERGDWTLLFNGCRCSVFQSENSSGGQLHNNVNVLNTTELKIWKLLRWQMLMCVLSQLKNFKQFFKMWNLPYTWETILFPKKMS